MVRENTEGVEKDRKKYRRNKGRDERMENRKGTGEKR